MQGHYGLIAIATILVIGFSGGTARADNVTLTSGSVSTLGGTGTVNLLSTSFSLRYTGEIPPGATTSFSMNSVTLALGLPNVTFNGTDSSFFTGALSFNNSLLTGNVTAYASMEDLFFGRSPLFTVNFSGAGFMTITQIPGRGTETAFTVATPEPATLILLGTALLGGAAFKRGRKRPGEPASNAEAEHE